MTWFLTIAGVLAVVYGFRCDRYEGTPPRIVWRQERLHRRPAQIWARWGRVLLGAGLIVAAGVTGLTVLAVLVAAAVTLVFLSLAWYGLRLLARLVEPTVRLVETFDDLDPALFAPHPTQPERPAIEPASPLEIL